MINVTKDKLFDYEYDQFGKTIENGFINLVECFFSSTPVECYDEQRSDTRKRRRTYACLEEEIGQERWNERRQSMASVCKKLSEDFKVALKRLNLSLVRTLDPINGSSNNLDSSSSSSTHHHIMRTCQPQRPVVNNSSRRAFSEPYRSDRPRVHLNRRKAAIPILNEERCESPMIGGEDLRDEIVGIELRRGELEFQEIIDPSIVSRALYENEKQDGAATDNHQKEHYYLNPSETVNLRSSIHLEDLKDYIQCEIQDGIESETQEIDCCIEDLKLRVSEVEQSSSSLKKLIPSISTLADHSPKLEHYKGILVRNMENRMDETRAEVEGRGFQEEEIAMRMRRATIKLNDKKGLDQRMSDDTTLIRLKSLTTRLEDRLRRLENQVLSQPGLVSSESQGKNPEKLISLLDQSWKRSDGLGSWSSSLEDLIDALRKGLSELIKSSGSPSTPSDQKIRNQDEGREPSQDDLPRVGEGFNPINTDEEEEEEEEEDEDRRRAIASIRDWLQDLSSFMIEHYLFPKFDPFISAIQLYIQSQETSKGKKARTTR